MQHAVANSVGLSSQSRGAMAISGGRLPRARSASSSRLVVQAAASEAAATTPKYCESVFQTRRRPTRTMQVGKVLIGGSHPVRLQTMTTSDTRDVEATVAQVKRCADAGAELVRITVQGKKEAAACMKIRERLFQDNYDTPLVADIHFQPGVAMAVADAFEKIRINPGNFLDGRKTFEVIDYDDPAQFAAEREEIARGFAPLVEKLKRLNRALRIGTNHGSLSARVLSFYGDTPRGMVESAFEFADVCRDLDYHNFCFSMKASNPRVMVAAYRLLAEEQYARGWDYPLHLGVTEAGVGEDGRLKSALGIGTLLLDGLGDTVRVSLTEDPWLELGPGRALTRLGAVAADQAWGVEPFPEHRDTHAFARRAVRLPCQRASDGALDLRSALHRDGSVMAALDEADLSTLGTNPEAVYQALGCKLAVGMPIKDIGTVDSVLLRALPAPEDASSRQALRRLQQAGVHLWADADALRARPLPGAVAVFSLPTARAAAVPLAAAPDSAASKPLMTVPLPPGALRFALSLDGSETEADLAALGDLDALAVLLRTAPGLSFVHGARRVFEALRAGAADVPVVLHYRDLAERPDREGLIFNAGSQLGALLMDALGDGVLVEAARGEAAEGEAAEGEDIGLEAPVDLAFLKDTAFGVLQGARMRSTKTEYVSCPSCGRTLFDLQEVTAQIKRRTGHLPGVAIAVMGCIVNGPGEMADADFGYVGGAPGKIDLYVNKDVIKRGVPMEHACDELIELIKAHGRWQDPPVEAAGAKAQTSALAA